jgi:glucan phosphoethanolaminetransferase (alkaline phosphatase superfamily)
MKECTLALVYLVKWAELGCTIAWIMYTFINGMAFIKKVKYVQETEGLEGEDHSLSIYLTYVALAFTVIHLIYMNLLINVRFYLAISC